METLEDTRPKLYASLEREEKARKPVGILGFSALICHQMCWDIHLRCNLIFHSFTDINFQGNHHPDWEVVLEPSGLRHQGLVSLQSWRGR